MMVMADHHSMSVSWSYSSSLFLHSRNFLLLCLLRCSGFPSISVLFRKPKNDFLLRVSHKYLVLKPNQSAMAFGIESLTQALVIKSPEMFNYSHCRARLKIIHIESAGQNLIQAGMIPPKICAELR